MMTKALVRWLSGDYDFFLDLFPASSDVLELPGTHQIGDIVRIGPCLMEIVALVE